MALEEEFLKLSGTNYWLAEFTSLYGDFNEYDFTEDYETLEQWYDETYEKYKNDRGVKQNPLIGSDIDTIISSEYTINYQVEATKHYVENIYAELGIDMTVDDFIAKNALMAEYMMQNSNFDDVIKDYNVSIKFVVDNLQRGTFEEKNGTTAVLSDFQTIEFDDTIEKVGSLDKDNDTLTNKAELGEVKWQDITGFVEKMYQSKYGTNMTMYESKVDEMVINNGGYTDFYGNFVFGHVKKEKDLLGNIKVFYRVYDYKSNPVLKDTDFDGMDDAADSRPKDNKFQGMAKIERNQNLKVDYHNDYRHFFIDNNKYNSELAEMSLMISNLANDEDRTLDIYQGGTQVGMMNTGGVFIGNMNITEYLSKIGFVPLTTMSLSNGKAYLSYKIVNYYGKEKLIFGIFIGGFDDEESYIKFITDTNNMHQNYEEIVNSIVNKIDNLKNLDLIKHYLNGQNYCYFITGKGIAGAVAAEVATKLGDTHNIYCYTFGMPNIKNSPTLSYIKNIVNEDDLLTKIHSDIGQDGDVYNKSIYWDLIPEYRHYVESPNRYKGNYKKTNTIRDNLEDIKRSLGWSDETRNIFTRELSEYLYSQIGERIITLHDEIFHDSRDYSTANNEIEERLVEIEEFTDSLTTANSTKAYWCLVKVLDGYDSKYYYEEEKKFYTDKVQGMTGTQEITIGDDELGDLDGYPFAEYNDVDIVYDASDEETVHIKNFMYSNYTIDSNGGDNVERNINYVKFWKDGTDNGKLSEYKAGDYNMHTVFTSEKKNQYYKNFEKSEGRVFIKNVDGIYTIYGRILAAFPPALKGEEEESNEFKKSTSNMNRVKNYKLPNKWENNVKGVNSQKDGGDYDGKANITLGPNEMYKLVDCVFENKDKQQFVVPFIIMDAKKVHLTPNVNDMKEISDTNPINYFLSDNITKAGKMSNLTDNRYGQVTEYMVKDDPVRYEYNIITNRTNPNDEKLITREAHDNNGYDSVTYVSRGKPITYFSRDEARDVVNISPIEPLADGGSSKDLMEVMFGDKSKNYRLISMRIYKSKGTFTATGAKLDIRIADNNGVQLNSLWYGEKSLIDEDPNFFDEDPNTHKKKENIIVDYR